ncbi:MAG: metallophosphoesterase, partial [Actinomycetota bacterium]
RRPGRLGVLHVSDLHLLPGQDHRMAFLARLGELDHDLTVITGDLLGAPGTEELTADAVAPLLGEGRPGLVVLGSNDRFGPVVKAPWRYLTEPGHRAHGQPLDTPRLVARLGDHGYRVLVDRTERVETRAGTVTATGLDDPHLPWTRLPSAAELGEVDADALLHLGLVHSPYLAALDTLVDAGCDLLLAGHTHGGQVRLPGLGALVANCDLPLDQVRGASRHGGRWLHVSAGLGHSRYAPIRFACPPEATLLELTD